MTRATHLHADCNSGTTRWVGALLCVCLAVVVLAVDLPLVHEHDRPGFYDEDCALVRLATHAPRLARPQSVEAPRPLPAPEAPPPARSAEPATARVLASAPRAPPVVI